VKAKTNNNQNRPKLPYNTLAGPQCNSLLT